MELQEKYVTLSDPIFKDNEKNNRQQDPIQKFFEKYNRYKYDQNGFFNLHDPLPGSLWWFYFFEKGIADKEQLEKSILNSIHFSSKNRPQWFRLYHTDDLSDENFAMLITEVEREYSDKKYIDLGEIKHIVGLFLIFSHAGLYNKSKKEILEEAKLYIDYLKNNKKIELDFPLSSHHTSYKGRGFQGQHFDEFQELSSYIQQATEFAIEERMPEKGRELVSIMQNDCWEFCGLICSTNLQNGNLFINNNHEVPIFKYIDAKFFIEALLSMSFLDQKIVFEGLNRRYQHKSYNKKLREELPFFKSIRHLLLTEIELKKGKLSGFNLGTLVNDTLDTVLEKLENIEKLENE